MAAPLLHTRLPGDAAASSSAVKTLGASRTRISNMRALENDFFNSPPRKTVRFGGTVTEVLLKYKKGETNDFELLKNQLLDPDIKILKAFYGSLTGDNQFLHNLEPEDWIF
ncbi:putative RRN3-like protein RRN3P2 isoform X2 [Pan troglodytes]|uniref:putative RRN3-like protein RRN3P2 isoform X2 n=1 Tax=Pan troglodytes TaxID=9598 RepID=UPI0023F2258E|nr:putative RRN3-like protein RRN3P2 isoform X2 [Pan troglodytes]